MGREEKQSQQPAKADAASTAKATETASGAQAVEGLLRAGGIPPVASVVAIIERHPGDRDAIFLKLQQTVGNQYVQQVIGAATKAEPHGRDLDTGLHAGRRATEMMEIARSTMFPAYRRAVDAIDPIASLELARHVVGALQVAEDGKREVVATLGDNDPHRFMTSSPGKPDESEAVVMSKWSELEMIRARLLVELPSFELDLAMRIGPQQFRGAPVLGSFTVPKLGAKPTEYLTSEAGTMVGLLAAIVNVRQAAGATNGMCPILDPEKRRELVDLVEPWRSRPVNFAFMVHILVEEGIWDAISAETTSSGRTLAQTEQSVLLQVKQTGALADVGSLDNDRLTDLLEPKQARDDDGMQDSGDRPAALPGDTAIEVFQGIESAAPNARGALVLQIQQLGHLDDVFANVPWKAVQALHDAIHPFDARTAALLSPFFDGKGGGTSMDQIYEHNITEDLEAGQDLPVDFAVSDGAFDPRVRAFLWTFLATAHNAVSVGFEHEYSAALEANQQGLITDGELYSQATRALGKAAVITLASALSGGIAGHLGEGVAAGAGLGKSASQIIGAGVGGFGAGVGGKLGGDIYDQLLDGKEGFDTFGSYMEAGVAGGVMGSVLGGVSVGAGKYLGEAAPVRPIDGYAKRFPKLAGVLEQIRSLGFGAGRGINSAATSTAIKLELTVRELLEMIRARFALPRLKLNYATVGGDLGSLPPSTPVSVTLRPTANSPMMMSSVAGGAGAGGAGGARGGPAGTSNDTSEADVTASGPAFEIESIEPSSPPPNVSVAEEKLAKGRPEHASERESSESEVDGIEANVTAERQQAGGAHEPESAEVRPVPRTGKLNPSEVEHIEKGELQENEPSRPSGGGDPQVARGADASQDGARTTPEVSKSTENAPPEPGGPLPARQETKYTLIEITDVNGSPIGELDEVIHDGVATDRFVEDKNARGLAHPRNQQTPQQWARKQIYEKTEMRIKALDSATGSRPAPSGKGTAAAPTLEELRSIREFEFVVESVDPQVETAVETEVAKLQTMFPEFRFKARFGG